MIDMSAPFRLDPQAQRGGNYARQRQMTLSDLLMENRIIFLGSSPETGFDPEITDYMANITIQRLLYLQYENKNQEIHMYINSPGGSVYATLAIYDTMQFLECPIATYCMAETPITLPCLILHRPSFNLSTDRRDSSVPP